jgi:hypothetical protein
MKRPRVHVQKGCVAACPNLLGKLPLALFGVYARHIMPTAATPQSCSLCARRCVFQPQTAGYLYGDALDAWWCEVRVVSVFPLVLLELIQVGTQQLTHQDQVLLQALGQKSG